MNRRILFLLLAAALALFGCTPPGGERRKRRMLQGLPGGSFREADFFLLILAGQQHYPDTGLGKIVGALRDQ
jgi:hypothetical protein